MKILVTGGAGFIGSQLVDHYISLGHQVVVVDDLSTGCREFINSRAKFYQLDICDSGLKDIFQQERPEIVNHHAAQMDIRKSVTEPVDDARVNIIGSLRIIENCLKLGVKKIIFASSGGAIYGEPQAMPVGEDHPWQPVSPYGVAKLSVERYLFASGCYTELDYTILRYANVYGPRQNAKGEAGVCAIFARNTLADRECILYGQGTPVRDYVYVDDIVRANELALTKGSRGIYNLGTGVGTSVREIFQIIQELTGTKAVPQEKPLRQGELQGIYLNCLRAEEEIGWQARTSLPEGLRRTVEYFRG